jgi:hypothetical protein
MPRELVTIQVGQCGNQVLNTVVFPSQGYNVIR